MFKGKSVCVVMPAYNEEEAIVQVIKDFNKSYVDAIIIVDNNSTDSTSVLAKNEGAIVITETKQGQGHAMTAGLKEGYKRGYDYVIITESDTTFLGKDMEKLFAYIDDAEIISGSRVIQPLIGPKAMGWYGIAGNFVLGGMITMLFNRKSRLNDVGVTFKLFKRDALGKVLPYLSVGGSDSVVEHFLIPMKLNIPLVQIPIWYTSRRGLTKQSFGIWSSFKIGCKHFSHILEYKFNKKIGENK